MGRVFSFIETRLFTRLVREYLTDDEYRKLQTALIEGRRKPGRSFPAVAVCASYGGERLVGGSAAVTG